MENTGSIVINENRHLHFLGGAYDADHGALFAVLLDDELSRTEVGDGCLVSINRRGEH